MVLGENINAWFLLPEILTHWSGLRPRHQGFFVFVLAPISFESFLGDAAVESS